MVKKHLVEEACFIINWLLSRAPSVFSLSVKLWKQSLRLCLYQRCSCPGSSTVLHQKHHAEHTKNTIHTHMKKKIPHFVHSCLSQQRCSRKIVCSSQSLESCTGWEKTTEALKRLRAYSHFGEHLALSWFAKLMGCFQPGIWCPGVIWHLQTQPETSGGSCRCATCLERVLHWCSSGQRHLV